MKYVPLAIAVVCMPLCLPARAEDISSDEAMQKAAEYRANGQSQDAVQLLKRAQKEDPENAILLRQLGYALVATDNPQEAVNVFDQLIALTPDDARAYSGKAVAFDHAGNHTAAQELHEKALALDGNSPAVRNNMALSYILDGQPDKAIALLKPLAKSDNPTIRQNLALAYGVKGEKAKALELAKHDLSEKEAQENLKFYDRYAKALAEQKTDDLNAHVTADNIALPDEAEAPAIAQTAETLAPAATAPAPTPAPTPTPTLEDEQSYVVDGIVYRKPLIGKFWGYPSVLEFPNR